jgi:hypothetical protein
MIYRPYKNIPASLLLRNCCYISFTSFSDININSYNTNNRIISEQLIVI